MFAEINVKRSTFRNKETIQLKIQLVNATLQAK